MLNRKLAVTASKLLVVFAECAENVFGSPSTACLVQWYVRKMEATNSDTFKIGNNILMTEHTFGLADQLGELGRANVHLYGSETEMCQINTVNAPFSGIPV